MAMSALLQRPYWPVRGEAGVTLTELIVVVTIIGIVAMMAAPNFMESIRRSRLSQATTELYGSLSAARMAAMGRNRTVTVRLVGATSTTSGSNVTITGTAAVPITVQFFDSQGVGVLPKQVLTTDIVQVETIPGAGSPTITSQVQFNSLGMRVGGGATVNQLITLRNNRGTAYSIYVTPAGKARWCTKATCP
jgi:prepilin-type N-terminal cleavage/methylation domain-containing protein